jgi:hypothetical protein
VAKNRKAGFGPASQGWRRHSASIGYRPHPGNHIHRWEDFIQKVRAVNSTSVLIYYFYEAQLRAIFHTRESSADMWLKDVGIASVAANHAGTLRLRTFALLFV